MKASLLTNVLISESSGSPACWKRVRESLACWNAALDELLDLQQLCEGELILVEALDWYGAHATANVNTHLPYTEDHVSCMCLCCVEQLPKTT